MATILITGIAGSLARLTAMALLDRGDTVVGVDYRPVPTDLPKAIVCYQSSYTKTRIVDIFRRHRPEGVLHLGRVGNLSVRSGKRFDLNVVGGAKIQDVCLRMEVNTLVVLSTYHIYGAHPHNHTPIFEDEPMRALQTVPELSDAVQMDTQAVTWSFRHPEMKTIIVRATNVVGPNINNTISRLMRLHHIPYLSGYNPMWQFIYETDMVQALMLALDGERSGIFNVSGRGALPLVEALDSTGRSLRPILPPLLKSYLRVSRNAKRVIPAYLVNFLKYPVIISDARFRETFDYQPNISIPDALRACASRIPVG